MANINEMAAWLKRSPHGGTQAQTPLNLAMMARALKAPPTVVSRPQDAVTGPGGVMTPSDRSRMPGHGPGDMFVPGAGQFGLGGTFLPSQPGPPDPGPGIDPGPIEPDILPQPIPVSGREVGPTVDVGGPRSGFVTSPFGGSFQMLPGETPLGGGLAGYDANGNPVYNPLGFGPMSSLERLNVASNGPTGSTSYGGGSNNKKASGHDANWWVF